MQPREFRRMGLQDRDGRVGSLIGWAEQAIDQRVRPNPIVSSHGVTIVSLSAPWFRDVKGSADPAGAGIRAWMELTRRLGRSLDPADLAAMDPDELAADFSIKPALHRFRAAMTKRTQQLCHIVLDSYDGDARGGVDGGGSVLPELVGISRFRWSGHSRRRTS